MLTPLLAWHTPLLTWRTLGRHPPPSQRAPLFHTQSSSVQGSPSGPRLCVPKGADKVPLLEQVHASRMSAHCRCHRTLARATVSFCWAGMYGDVVKHVESCHCCQLAKGECRAAMGDPLALDIPGRWCGRMGGQLTAALRSCLLAWGSFVWVPFLLPWTQSLPKV